MLKLKREGSFAVKVDRVKKIVTFDVVGQYDEETSKQFINKYNSAVNTIVPKDFTLILECKDMKVVPVDMVPALEQCLILYKDSGFKSVIFNLPENAILKMQVSRLARNIQLDNAEINVIYPRN